MTAAGCFPFFFLVADLGVGTGAGIGTGAGGGVEGGGVASRGAGGGDGAEGALALGPPIEMPKVLPLLFGDARFGEEEDWESRGSSWVEAKTVVANEELGSLGPNEMPREEVG